MEVNLSDQLRALVISLVAGGGLGLLYDGRNAFRIRTAAGRILCAAAFLAASFLWLWVTGMVSGGGVRVSFLCGAAAGACFYFALLRQVFVRGFQNFRHFIHIIHK